VLSVRAVNLKGRPAAGISFTAGPPTGKDGRTKIRLSADTREGDWVKLGVSESPRPVVMVSPWNGLVRILETPAVIVLAEAGDRAILENTAAVASLAARALASGRIADVAIEFRLDAADMEKAIRGLSARSRDPFETGLSKLFQRDYADAAKNLAQALKEREKQLTRDAAEIADAASFLGMALAALEKWPEAAVAYQRAMNARADDAEILEALGAALVKSGKPDAGEPFLKQARELKNQ
jgi:tetratricopeptide (TPR) repeat protein